MIIVKNKIAINKMRVAGRLLAGILNKVSPLIVEGVSTLDLDAFIYKEIQSVNLKAECKGYSGYQHATCISLNDVIVHGVPSDKVVLKNGDFVKIDVVASYNGYCADLARYFFVGKVNDSVKKIAGVAQEALDTGIDRAVVGARVSDISASIQKIVESKGFGVVRDFAGHGIGRSMHEDPNVPNFGSFGCGPVLREGMTLAIEPMIVQGKIDVKVMSDGWTAKTCDGGLAAHVEDTVLITKGGPEILTRI